MKSAPDVIHGKGEILTDIVAVDWGTTSLRIWGLDHAGNITAERRGPEGMFGLAPSEFPKVLERHLTALGIKPKVPAIICGMAGAATGWVEAAYADIPTPLARLAEAAIETRTDKRPVLILPGIAQRDEHDPDVMRGEETLLLGAHIEAKTEGMICLPGTHSKWAELRQGVVTGFKTSMTGEAFALFSKTSTLAQFASGELGQLDRSSAFSDAVTEALEAPQEILHRMFSVRSMPLLQGQDRAADMPARLSGLLVGLEIAGMNVGQGRDVTLISSGAIARTYEHALNLAGANVINLDADTMVRTGLHHCARQVLLPSYC